MPLPRREDYPDCRSWQDANVRFIAEAQIAYCAEREAARGVEEWTWEPEPTADGLEDLL